jgi:hypothetical protein
MEQFSTEFQQFHFSSHPTGSFKVCLIMVSASGSDVGLSSIVNRVVR